MLKFESLGGDYPGCEIGLIQRQFGAEPLSLLRWTTIRADALLDALASGFSGVGSPGQTELYVVPETQDYKTKDRRFGMDMVTFVKSHTQSHDAMHTRVTKRIRFLCDKLLNDLASSEKIFVYRCFRDDLQLAGIQALKHSMSHYGKNRLLYVRLANDVFRSGQIQQVSDDLIIGFVARFSGEPMRELFLEGWLEMFQATAAVWCTDGQTAIEAHAGG